MKHSDLPHSYDHTCRCKDCVLVELRIQGSIKQEHLQVSKGKEKESNPFKSFQL
jgi:hypothetical protein